MLTGQGAQIDTTTAAGRLVFGIFAALVGSLRAFRMAMGRGHVHGKTATTIGRNAVSGCNIGCNIRSSVMLHRFLAPERSTSIDEPVILRVRANPEPHDAVTLFDSESAAWRRPMRTDQKRSTFLKCNEGCRGLSRSRS